MLPSNTFQRNNDTSLFAFSDTLCTYILTIRQGYVDDSSFVRGHCLQRDGATIVAYLLRHA